MMKVCRCVVAVLLSVAVRLAEAAIINEVDDEPVQQEPIAAANLAVPGQESNFMQEAAVSAVEVQPVKPEVTAPKEKDSLVKEDKHVEDQDEFAIPPDMHLVPHTRAPKVPFGLFRTMLSRSTIVHMEPPQPMPDNGRSNIRMWVAWYAISAGLLFIILMRFCNGMEVNCTQETAGTEMEVLRGRSCWPICIMIMCACLSGLTFMMTIQNCQLTNLETQVKPTSQHILADSTIVITRHFIENPGERAFLAAHSVTLSVFTAILYLWSWRKQDNVDVSASLLAQYAFRGGTLSLAVALALESAGMMFLHETGAMEAEGANMSTALIMSVVGFSEEFAKIIAVSWGTVILVNAVSSTESYCCTCVCRTIVDSPKALMLAALAAGFGFMTVENAGYVMVAAMTPPTTEVVFSNKGADMMLDRVPRHAATGSGGRKVVSEDTVDAVSITFWTMTTIAIRVLLNIHPWLAGVSAGRLAKTVFKDYRPTACAGPGEMFDAYWPSSVVHAAYDWWVTAIQAPLALLAPPVCWYMSKRDFGEYWKEMPDGASQVAG